MYCKTRQRFLCPSLRASMRRGRLYSGFSRILRLGEGELYSGLSSSLLVKEQWAKTASLQSTTKQYRKGKRTAYHNNSVQCTTVWYVNEHLCSGHYTMVQCSYQQKEAVIELQLINVLDPESKSENIF